MLCARSSMDRIMDSGSIDWGSTPHGRTKAASSCLFYLHFMQIHLNLIMFFFTPHDKSTNM